MGRKLDAFQIVVDDMSYSEQFRLWNTKRAWCLEQGWQENIDFWPPGMISGEWHFQDPRNLTLFLLRWS